MTFDILMAALRTDEGIRLKPYLDTASPPRVTIGYGRNLSDNGISLAEAEFMLTVDAQNAIRECVGLVAEWANLDDVRKAVLANMMFNMGRSRLSGFRNFLNAVNDGRFDDAAVEMLASKWATQVGKRAQRLAKEMRDGG